MLVVVTAITRWQKIGAKGLHSFRGPLPEPPRYRRVSKSAPAPTDRLSAALEEWLGALVIATTVDAD